MSSGLVQDQTLWSDPIRTDCRKWWGWAGGGPQGNLGKQTQAVTQKIVPRHGQVTGLIIFPETSSSLAPSLPSSFPPFLEVQVV